MFGVEFLLHGAVAGIVVAVVHLLRVALDVEKLPLLGFRITDQFVARGGRSVMYPNTAGSCEEVVATRRPEASPDLAPRCGGGARLPRSIRYLFPLQLITISANDAVCGFSSARPPPGHGPTLSKACPRPHRPARC